MLRRWLCMSPSTLSSTLDFIRFSCCLVCRCNVCRRCNNMAVRCCSISGGGVLFPCLQAWRYLKSAHILRCLLLFSASCICLIVWQSFTELCELHGIFFFILNRSEPVMHHAFISHLTMCHFFSLFVSQPEHQVEM